MRARRRVRTRADQRASQTVRPSKLQWAAPVVDERLGVVDLDHERADIARDIAGGRVVEHDRARGERGILDGDPGTPEPKRVRIGVSVGVWLTPNDFGGRVREGEAGCRCRHADGASGLQLGEHVERVHSEQHLGGGVRHRTRAEVPLANGGPESSGRSAARPRRWRLGVHDSGECERSHHSRRYGHAVMQQSAD